MTRANAPSRDELQQLVQWFGAQRYGELEARAQALLKRYPASGIVWKILGTACLVQGKDGLQALQRAALFLPTDPECHSNLGNMYKALGRPQDAVASYRQALKLRPDFAAAHYNLGTVMRELGQAQAAADSLGRAVALQPGLTDAHYNLGIVLAELGRLDDAEASYRRTLALQADHAGAGCNLGIVLKDRGRFEAAMASFRDVLARHPDHVEALNNLGMVLKDLGHLEEALAAFRRVLDLRPEHLAAYSNLLFTHNYLPHEPPEVLLGEARAYGAAAAARAAAFTTWPNPPDPARRLRVGLVSGDLREHPVGHFLEAVLRVLGQRRERLGLFAYDNHGGGGDALTARLRAACEGWQVVAGVPDPGLAERIRQDGIDLLIDLSGHTGYNRLPLFALKPAPVQLSWLGYFATTGVAAIDHVIADPWTVPEADDAHFTEHVWRLPETRLCFTPPAEAPPVAPLPALAADGAGGLTFGCFNNVTKLNDEVLALWARVLQAVPGSRLMLKAKQLDEAVVREDLLRRFATLGIAAGRLRLAGRSPRADYLAAYGQVDIGLDPFPFTGGTTSAESLWMGVPVLTLAGDRLVSRQGVGLMVNAGLPDWVATDPDDFVARAVCLAADLPALAALRAGLRAQVQGSPLFDAPRFADHFEAALRAMWQQWCQGVAR